MTANVHESSPAWKVVTRAVTIQPKFDLPLTEAETLLNSVSRFPPNPEPNWGPGSRPNNKKKRGKGKEAAPEKKQKAAAS